jgi:hypothetical protein
VDAVPAAERNRGEERIELFCGDERTESSSNVDAVSAAEQNRGEERIELFGVAARDRNCMTK